MLIPASKFLHFIKSHTCVGEKVQQVKFDQLILIPGKLQVIDSKMSQRLIDGGVSSLRWTS